jgi:hypothetical protein
VQRIALRKVAQATDEQHAAVSSNRRNRQLDGKFLAVLSKPRNFNAPAQNVAPAGFEISLQSGSVGVAVTLRDDKVGHGPPDRLVARPAEHTHRAIVPILNDAVGPHNHDGVERGFQDQAQSISRQRCANGALFCVGTD